eukprot:GHVU01174940.1.p1 GENE.GHVU01174940.1~~GHVU01174940.1.p1  ORF type:complete len:201 (-),score=33.02 GHVU01174940.1:2142-2744(-)
MAGNVSQNLQNWKSQLEKKLQEKNACTDILEKIEKKTNVKRLHLVLGIAAVIALWLMVGYGAQFLCNFLGFLYPAYASVKAIESKGKDDDTKWLTYWVVYSTFSLVEFFTDIFLFWIPFYWLLKCMFLIYCMVPFPWNGSLTIYNRFIRPFILKHQNKVDQALDKAKGVASDVLQEAESTARDAGAEAIRRQIDDAAKMD